LVEGERPGHVFKAPNGPLVLRTSLNLAARDKITRLEVIENGRVKKSFDPTDLQNEGGQIPLLEFNQSGWFLIRALTDNEKTFRFASTAPYYLQIGDKPHISRGSVRFFLDWVNERQERVKVDNARQRAEVLKHHAAARRYWQKLLSQATAP
jgi:hypothetical protein